jgi:hypothetical protein
MAKEKKDRDSSLELGGKQARGDALSSSAGKRKVEIENRLRSSINDRKLRSKRYVKLKKVYLGSRNRKGCSVVQSKLQREPYE